MKTTTNSELHSTQIIYLEKVYHMLHYATRLNDLRAPPGSRLESLSGDLQGFCSIRISNQWRIVFRWTDAGPCDVQITDYHP